MKKRSIIVVIILILSILCMSEWKKTFEIDFKNTELINSYFEEQKKTNSTNNNPKESYLGILEIPSINLKRGFYSYNNLQNTVEKNIEVINKNCLPYGACPFILASHSGTSNIAFFKNLFKLKEQDLAILYYQNKKKEYLLKEIQYQEKNGSITLDKNNDEQLILTTCNKENNSLQDIYIFYPLK